MHRRSMIALIALGVVLFVVISGLLARALSLPSSEQLAITDLVGDEARGDTGAVLAAISGCRDSTACRTRAAQLTSTLRRPGRVSVLQVTTPTSFSLATTEGTARVAWEAGGSLPRVQCVRVRAAGDVLGGFRIELLEVSARIRSDAYCPSRF